MKMIFNVFQTIMVGLENWYKEKNKSNVISDDYQLWINWCPTCKKKSMAVVRPGKIQCDICGE